MTPRPSSNKGEPRYDHAIPLNPGSVLHVGSNLRANTNQLPRRHRSRTSDIVISFERRIISLFVQVLLHYWASYPIQGTKMAS